MSIVRVVSRYTLLSAIVLAAVAQAAPPAPAYSYSRNDAVTGDNALQSFTHPNASCSAGSPCRLPDPNPPAGSVVVDRYTDDLYERPSGSGSDASRYYAAIDIVSSLTGFDSEYLYYRINLYGVDAGSGNLPYFYSYEINFDNDPQGDMLVRVASPGSNVGTTFGVAGVIGFLDLNNNMGGANKSLPDGPGGAGNGYEYLAFDQGTNNLAGSPGGSDAIVARIMPGSPATVELAVKRSFMNAAKGSAVTSAQFRSFASKGSIGEGFFELHDNYGRNDSGSPYPFLQSTGAPASCPNGNDNTLTTAQRTALESGTNVNTGIFNPCYPTTGIYEIDNDLSVSGLASGISFVFDNPSISKSFTPAAMTTGYSSVLTIVLGNPSVSAAMVGATFTDTFPVAPGAMTLFDTVTSNTCGGTLTDGAGGALNAGDVAIKLTGGTIPFNAGGTGSCTVTVNVAVTAQGAYTNTIPAGALTTSNAGSNQAAATAVLTVNNPLLVVKSSSVISDPYNGSINPKRIPGAIIQYTVIVSNAGGAYPATDVVISDAIPSNTAYVAGSLVVAGTAEDDNNTGADESDPNGGDFNLTAAGKVTLRIGSIAAGAATSGVFRVVLQ